MDRILLQAQEREILGKKVKNLRKAGQLPGHVFGKKINTEHVSIDTKLFVSVYLQAGETGLIDLKVGSEKVRPVLIREVQYDPVTLNPLHVDFYQVNLSEKVKVPVPIEIIGEEPEKVHLGEAIILQTLNEVEVEALPTDLIEKIEVDISALKEIDDAITVGQLIYDHSKITVIAEPEEIVVKLDTAVSAETEALLAEQEAEAAAVVEEQAIEEGAEGEEKTVEQGAETVEGQESEVKEEVKKDSPAGEEKSES